MSPEARHWTVIETGANQRYVFESNRRRQNIGSSELIRRVGEVWVREAAETSDGVEVVVASSGRALLLAEPAQARAVVTAVTRRALLEAPGLEVWGTVCSVPVGNEHPAVSLARAYREHAAARSRIVSPDVRDARLPMLAIDSFYGQPVASVERRNDTDERFGRRASAADAAAVEARRRLVARLSSELEAVNADAATTAPTVALDALPSERALMKGIDVVDEGRVAVVHADGNGIGALFLSLSRLDEHDFAPRTRTLSQALDAITWRALARAVDETHRLLNSYLDAPSAEAREEIDPPRPRTVSGWILPVLVGGDDLTVIVAGRAAYPFTTSYLRAFEAEAASHESISQLLQIVRETGAAAPRRLTAAAGIAAVDARHPFSHAYELAAELCDSAKRGLRTRDEEFSAFDVHVLFESSVRHLEQIRSHLILTRDGSTRQLWAGPVVVEQVGGHPTSTRIATTTQLDKLIGAMTTHTADAPAVLTSGAAHRVRAALLEHPEALDREVEAVIRNARDSTAVSALLDQEGLRSHSNHEPLLLLTALDLVDLAEERIA